MAVLVRGLIVQRWSPPKRSPPLAYDNANRSGRLGMGRPASVVPASVRRQPPYGTSCRPVVSDPAPVSDRRLPEAFIADPPILAMPGVHPSPPPQDV